MRENVFLLSPSRGMGGGIERYVQAVEWAFAAKSIPCWRADLTGRGLRAHVDMLARVRRQVREGSVPTRIVVAHRALLPLAYLVVRDVPTCGISVACHGIEAWGTRRGLRWLAESYLMRRSRVRVISVSSFTAGALGRGLAGTVLPPGLSRQWFEALVVASNSGRRSGSGVHLVTAFRLADWRDKGLPELLQAVANLGSSGVRLTVCGSGEPSHELLELVHQHPFCWLRSDLSDIELACHLAEADLFVLATRTRLGVNGYGEGFGLVLLEAQVAGTPVVAPARGGSFDAYLEGVTGVAPTNESAASLAILLGELLREPGRLELMGKSAAEWARESFEPDRYAARVVARLL